MTEDLKGQVVIVTGASRGIGKTIAQGLAQHGATVVIAARSTTQGRLPGTIYSVADEIKASGGKALALPCDVGKWSDVENLISQAIFYLGRIDVVVNNAAIYPRTPSLTINEEVFDAYMDINIRGYYFVAKAATPYMITQGGGSVINVTSAAATATGQPHLLMYSITKASVNRMTTYLATDWKQYNIAVNAISPGYVKTENLIDMLGEEYDWSKDAAQIAELSPKVFGPPFAYLAKQRASGMTGRIVRVHEYGVTWP